MSTEVLEYLISKTTDIDVKDNSGRTPLHYGAEFGFINAVRMLVEHGANVNALDNEGNTPLDLAADIEKATYLAERMIKVSREQGKSADAIEVYKKLLNIQIKMKVSQLEVVETESNIAYLLYDEGKFNEALPMFKEIISKRNDLLGAYHFDALRTKYGLGKVHLALWNLDQASECFKEVFEYWKDALEASHKERLNVTRDLAFVLSKKGENDQAYKLFNEVFESRKLSLGLKHPDTLMVWLDMATVLVNKGENTEALRILNMIYDERKASLGADDTDTILVEHHISVVKERLKNATPNKIWYKH